MIADGKEIAHTCEPVERVAFHVECDLPEITEIPKLDIRIDKKTSTWSDEVGVRSLDVQDLTR